MGLKTLGNYENISSVYCVSGLWYLKHLEVIFILL